MENTIGNVTIIDGNDIKAYSDNGVMRSLKVGDPIFLNDRIVTGSGSSIYINLLDGNSLNLGRLSDFTIDGNAVNLDTVKEVADIQEQLLDENFDPTVDLESTAAGPGAGVAGAGGGHITVRFDLDGREVTPESGAETTGVVGDFTGTEPGTVPPTNTVEPVITFTTTTVSPVDPVTPVIPEIPIIPPPPPVESDDPPVAGVFEYTFMEKNLPRGTDPNPSQLLFEGDLTDIKVDFGVDTPGTIIFDGNPLLLDGDGDSIIINGKFGDLTFNDDGTWSFLTTNTLNHPLVNKTDSDDVLKEVFDFTVIDSDGPETAAGSITMNLEDDGPEVTETAKFYFISEYAGYNNKIGAYKVDDDGNPYDAKIIVDSTNSIVNYGQKETDLGDFDAGTKFFIISDGAKKSNASSNTELRFREGEGDEPQWVLQVSDGDSWVDADDAKGIYFMDSQWDTNPFPGPEGGSHFTDQWAESPYPSHFLHESPEYGGEVRIEDLNLGDVDYDDTVFRIEKGPVVSESGLPDGSGEDPNNTTVLNGNFFSATPDTPGIVFENGADIPLTLSLQSTKLPNINNFNDGRESFGQPINTVIAKDVATGTSVVINSEVGSLEIWENGDWEYTLINNTLTHPDNDKGGANNTDGDYDRFQDDQVQDVFMIRATDNDGDYVKSRFIININDDGPVVGEIEDTTIYNTPEASMTNTMELDYGADDQNTIIKLTGPTDDDGYVVDNDGDYLRFGGEKLTYVENSDGGLSAVDSNGTVVFTISPDAANDEYTVTMYESLDTTETITHNFNFNTNGAKPGNYDSVEFYSDKDLNNDGIGDIKVVMTGEGDQSDTVNVSKQGSGVHNNSIDEKYDDEMTMKFYDTTENPDKPMDIDNIDVLVDKLDEKPQQETMEWETFDDGNPSSTGSEDGEGQGASSNSDQIIEIEDENGFDEVKIEGSDGSSFRVKEGSIEVEEEIDEDPVEITYNVEIGDSDSDTDIGSFDVEFAPVEDDLLDNLVPPTEIV